LHHHQRRHNPLSITPTQLDDAPSKLATHYKHGQREFFKHVVSWGGLVWHTAHCITACPAHIPAAPAA
jgi:hypothetical protein